jgi:hypothetical protein
MEQLTQRQIEQIKELKERTVETEILEVMNDLVQKFITVDSLNTMDMDELAETGYTMIDLLGGGALLRLYSDAITGSEGGLYLYSKLATQKGFFEDMERFPDAQTMEDSQKKKQLKNQQKQEGLIRRKGVTHPRGVLETGKTLFNQNDLSLSCDATPLLEKINALIMILHDVGRFKSATYDGKTELGDEHDKWGFDMLSSLFQEQNCIVAATENDKIYQSILLLPIKYHSKRDNKNLLEDEEYKLLAGKKFRIRDRDFDAQELVLEYFKLVQEADKIDNLEEFSRLGQDRSMKPKTIDRKKADQDAMNKSINNKEPERLFGISPHIIEQLQKGELATRDGYERTYLDTMVVYMTWPFELKTEQGKKFVAGNKIQEGLFINLCSRFYEIKETEKSSVGAENFAKTESQIREIGVILGFSEDKIVTLMQAGEEHFKNKKAATLEEKKKTTHCVLPTPELVVGTIPSPSSQEIAGLTA